MIREVHTSHPKKQSPERTGEFTGRPQGDEGETTLVRTRRYREPVTGVRRIVYMILAGFFFILGVIGAILPVIPTTPFLLLTSFFLIRISPRLNDSLVKAPLVGPILLDWQQRRGVRPAVKIQAIVIVMCVVGSSLFFTPLPAFAKGILALLAVIGIGVILRIPTLSSDEVS
ncbi:MAG: YbaN family protein [Planctomycetaceae bacterium]